MAIVREIIFAAPTTHVYNMIVLVVVTSLNPSTRRTKWPLISLDEE
jgi:hypothetical protein